MWSKPCLQNLLERPQSSEIKLRAGNWLSRDLGDRLFDELAGRMATTHEHRLLFEHKLQEDLYAQIRLAAATYISAVLGCP
ncbi:MAG: hypothetical protein HC805_08160 [Alkalinema sp. RL_2_19]|nr:hypothetical protein [Alkalinema sp. RL_2_19]